MSHTCFCFDLDGTLTQSELLPIIASEINLENEFRLLTKLTMDGLIPFEDSFRLRFVLLNSIPLSRIHAAIERVALDQDIINFIQQHTEQCFIVTGNLDVWIEPLIKKIGCRAFTSQSYRNDAGELKLKCILRKNVPGLSLKKKFDRVVAIGDGFNDIPLFEVADIGIAYNAIHNSPESLLSTSNYVAFNGVGLCRLLNTLL